MAKLYGVVSILLVSLLFTSLSTAQEVLYKDEKLIVVKDSDVQKRIARRDKHYPYPAGKAPQFQQQRITLPDTYVDFLMSDFNDDGYPDIALLNREDEKVYIVFGDKKQKFSKAAEADAKGADYVFGGVADFNSDGALDLVYSNDDDKRYLSILPNDGKGNFKKAKHTKAKGGKASDANYIYPFDCNADGKPDLVGLIKSTYSEDGHIFVLTNKGNFKFNVTKIDDDNSYDSVIVGDFDNDGYDDFVTSTNEYSEPDLLTFFRSNGDGTFTKGFESELDDASEDYFAFDLDQNGTLDIVGNGNYSGRVFTAQGVGNGKFNKQKQIKGSGSLSYGACFSQFDSDNWFDMVAAESGGLRYYSGAKARKFKNPEYITSGLDFGMEFANSSCSVASCLVNKDKKPDIIGLQNFDEDYYNLMMFYNGEQPASLTIKELKITKKSFSVMFVTVKGSLRYTGKNIKLIYDKDGKTPTQSAFLQMRIYIDLPWPLGSATVRLKTTGEFLHKPGSNSGKIYFSITAPAGVMLIGTGIPILPIKVYDVYLWDYNLVRSNELDE